MSKLVVANNVTLDGVMQAPDPGGGDGFAHAGWAQSYDDDVKHQEMGKGMDTPEADARPGENLSAGFFESGKLAFMLHSSSLARRSSASSRRRPRCAGASRS